jgi:hypothetical protein
MISVEVNGEFIKNPVGIAIFHEDQSLFVACPQTVMKVTVGGCDISSFFFVSFSFHFWFLVLVLVLVLVSGFGFRDFGFGFGFSFCFGFGLVFSFRFGFHLP